MPFWNTKELMPFFWELADRATRTPVLKNFDDDDLVTQIVISKGIYGSSRRSRRSTSTLLYRNEKLNVYNTYPCVVAGNEKNFMRHVVDSGNPFKVMEGKDDTKILLDHAMTFGEFRNMMNHFITIYP